MKAARTKADLNIKEIFPEILEIKNEEYQKLVEEIWQVLWHQSEWEDIYSLPISPKINYPHIPHNRAVVKMAISVADIFRTIHGVEVNKDVLIAAGLLQDASKLVEFRPTEDGQVEYTKIGETYPHAFWGTHLALSHGLPDEICEIILDHTPDSARFPKSLEGKILYYVDQLDVIATYKDRFKKEAIIKLYK